MKDIRKTAEYVDELEVALARARIELDTLKEATCTWKQDEYDGSWDADCGLKWDFTDDGPEENECFYCPNCGKKIVIVPEPDETDEVVK